MKEGDRVAQLVLERVRVGEHWIWAIVLTNLVDLYTGGCGGGSVRRKCKGSRWVWEHRIEQ